MKPAMTSESTLPKEEGYLDSFDPELRRAFEFAHQKVNPELVDHSRVKMQKDSVLISGDGTFYTLQGEGPTMGLPCVFVRLHVCNLRCTWCDAWYTWNPNTEEFWTEPSRVSFSELAERIIQTWEGPPRAQKRVVFTGGEPLIQRKQLDEVVKLLNPDWYDELGRSEFVHHSEWEVEFETNGTLMPTKDQLFYAQFNVSPKLSNSDNNHHQMVKPKIIQALNKRYSTFKFVVTSPEDLDEIEELYLPHIDFDKVIIMPQGVTAEEVDMNAARVAEYVKEKGFRMLGRLQNQIWGARRGV